MPFQDPDWEDFQRDCDFFPAYTDYIFGIDTRPEVDNEPGLHPQIFDPQSPTQPLSQRLYDLPPPAEYPTAYDLVRDGTQARTYGVPALQRMSMLRQESSSESIQPTPCPAPRVLPTSGSQTQPHLYTMPGPQRASMLRQESSTRATQPSTCSPPRILPTAGAQEKLLRPNELTTDPSYHFIPQEQRTKADQNIVQAWSIVNSDAIPSQKAQAMGFILNMSRGAAAKLKEWEAAREIRVQAAMEADKEWRHQYETYRAEARAQREAEGQYLQYEPPALYPRNKMNVDHRRAEAEAERTAERASVPASTYAIRNLSELPAYVQSQLSQLWTCTDIINLQPPPTDPAQTKRYQQAQQYMTSFKQSVPPKGLPWIGLVVNGMIRLHKSGSSPMTMLQSMPSVEDALHMV